MSDFVDIDEVKMWPNNNTANSRTDGEDHHVDPAWRLTGRLSSRPCSHGRLRLSGAERHFQRQAASTTIPPSVMAARVVRGGGTPLETHPNGSLRFLCLMIRQLAYEQESTEAALSALERLGREVAELLGSLHTHFEDGPASTGILDFTMLQRTTLGDVNQWLRNHLAPLAASRQRTLMIVFDPRLDLLPANFLFSLIVEHLRKRIYDSAPGNQMQLKARLEGQQVRIEVLELGQNLPATPITDDATRLLWTQVVHLLDGSISWYAVDADPHAVGMPGNAIRVTYEIQSPRLFHADGATEVVHKSTPRTAA